VTENNAVGNVAALRLKTPAQVLAESSDLEDADVLDHIRETTHMWVARRRIAESQRAGIGPSCLVQVGVRARIEGARHVRIESPRAALRRQPGYATDPVRTLGPVEQ